MSEPRPSMLTYAQTAALVGKSVSTVERWVRNQNIPFHRIGRSIRFDASELRQWLEENEITTDNRIRPVRPLKKRPGAQHVYPSQTLGDEEHCWCGDLIGHDWVGKDTGAPHPHDHERKQQVVIVEQNTEPRNNRIERNDLRGYHATLKSFIVQCVNVDGLRWRGQGNSVLLFPPDDSQPVTVYCRNNDSQMRSLKQWYAAHVEPQKTVTEETVLRLAEEVNDPEEHPAKEPAPEPTPESEWATYLGTDGEPSEFYETDGTTVRCRLCVGTSTHYETDTTRITGLGGHVRMNHTDTTSLRTPEALEKRADSRRYNRLHDKVKAAVELLAETIDYTPSAVKVTEWEREIERLRHELEKETKRADDAVARVKLMQEAFRGLE